MSYTEINRVFNARIAAIPNVPPIINENKSGVIKTDPHNSASGATYLRTTLLPQETVETTFGPHGYNKWSGLFQIDLVYPFEDGTEMSDKLCDAIVAHFPGADIPTDEGFCIQVRTAWREASQQHTNYNMTPVVGRWETYIRRYPLLP